MLKTLYMLFAAITLGACSDVNDRNQLTVYVCDTPADYGGVTFYVTSVELRSAGADNWAPLDMPPSGYISLMELINGKMQEIGQQILPSGSSYDAVRMTFSTEKANVVVAGETIPMVLDPADAVVTVPFPAMTMDGPDRSLLFDIDVASSITEDATAENGYRFRPQVTFVDVDACGVVQGGLQAGEQAVTSRMWMRFTDDATGRISSTYCALNPIGAFFIRLVPGEYTLDVIPRDGAELKPYTAKVTVARQQITDLGIVVLESTSVQ